MITAIHAAWIPRENGEYLQPGWLCLWVEKSTANRTAKKSREHPSALRKEELEKFMAEEGGLGAAARMIGARVIDGYFTLPTAENAPLKSQELLKYLGEEAPEKFSLQPWQIAAFAVPPGEAPALLKELHFRFGYAPSETLLGADVLFWYHYTQAFKEIILKDQYIPALKYRELPPPKDKRRKQETTFEIHPAWEIVSSRYEEIVKEYAALMPPACAAGSLQPAGEGSFWNKEALLRHFSENLLHEIVSGSRFSAKLEKALAGTWVHACVFPWKKTASGSAINAQRAPEEALKSYQKWASWKSRLAGGRAAGGAALCFQLQEAQRPGDPWNVHFLAASQKDPSLRIALKDFWRLSPRRRAALQGNFGKEPEREILLNLGLAARIYPKIWSGLQTERPAGMELNLDEAFGFLKETAWVLEDAGYKVAIPAWWTPRGRRKAKIRLKTRLLKGGKTAAAPGRGLFGLDSIINYYYSLSIGGEEVSEAEWRALVSAKAPLVQFRGEWMELDRAKMQEMLAFWQAHGKEQPKMSLLDLLQISAKDDEYEIEHDAALAEMFDLLRDKRKFELLEDPPDFQGKLRDYQKRGVSWIAYLEKLGLGGCLADDMGLGKTIQVIARLLQERRETKKKPQPTLLLAPTSVLGNWQKEVERFAPGLAVLLHHGSGRIRDEKEFAKESARSDLVVSSYALARLDEALFTSREWERVVLDEAQNIKNPKAAQTRAILKIKARHRLALTGTPVENRLLDLWSIFNFLNSGYLGNNAAFRRSFEIPIQKENDPQPARVLKSLVEPFILRRLKTDKEIIKDLPDKVEQKIYCNLTKEQASLYQAVVNDVMRQLEELEGIQRKGLILASLMKLKQICNHPAQFLQDGSAFSAERSHKLSRLGEMIEEAIESGESLLIFSQFQEICLALDRYLRQTLHYNTYVLHGQTPRRKRQEMIEEFQHPDTEPSIFILSLKAGGVGITLTKANHVFHFDRWWNPAVENQATDRAFRIGQSKNVFVHKYLTTGTLEERIDAMIEEKKKLAEAIVGADESWLTELDNEAFKKLIELNKSAILE